VPAVEQDLRRLLDELRAAIDRTREGHEDRADLERLLQAVERRLEANPTEEEHGRLIGELREAAVRFESDHPVLGDSIRRAVNALAAAGI
jgi:uncharacterized protein DUF4404